MISDQGNNVNGAEIQSMCSELGIKKIRSSAYHPQGNGSAERAIGSMKSNLRIMCHSRSLDIHRWDTLLAEAVLHYNNARNSSSQFSPYHLAYGMDPVLPLDRMLGIATEQKYDQEVLQENALLNKREARENYQKQANQAVVVNDFKPGDSVLLQRTHGENPKMNPKNESPLDRAICGH